jgi:hypothetical protein
MVKESGKIVQNNEEIRKNRKEDIFAGLYAKDQAVRRHHEGIVSKTTAEDEQVFHQRRTAHDEITRNALLERKERSWTTLATAPEIVEARREKRERITRELKKIENSIEELSELQFQEKRSLWRFFPKMKAAIKRREEEIRTLRSYAQGARFRLTED